MTVNELIEHLKSLGDEKWRNVAEVKIIHNVKYEDKWGGVDDLMIGSQPIDTFDVKAGVNSVDIHIEEDEY